MTKWLTPKEAAEIYGVSDRHMRNLCARGEIECMKLGKLWRIAADEKKVAPAGATASASHEKGNISHDGDIVSISFTG